MSLNEYLGLLREWYPGLLAGTLHTIQMAVLAFLVAMTVAIPVAAARMSSNRLLSGAARTYINIARGTPLLVQLFLIYYVLPELAGIVIPAFQASVIGIGLYYAAYIAQTYRTGIESIDTGQREAAQAIGLTRKQWFPSIILPQAIPVIVPPTLNYLIWIVQDTSIASLVSAPELMLAAKEISAEYFTPFEIYVTAGAIYLLIGYALSKPVALLAARRERGRSKGQGLSHFYW
jgi:His/Glu/Gln/Arg/opine family amino acid ABC transporter permease subunit